MTSAPSDWGDSGKSLPCHKMRSSKIMPATMLQGYPEDIKLLLNCVCVCVCVCMCVLSQAPIEEGETEAQSSWVTGSFANLWALELHGFRISVGSSQ